MTLAVFHDFPSLENGLTEFHDIPGRVVTRSEITREHHTQCLWSWSMVKSVTVCGCTKIKVVSKTVNVNGNVTWGCQLTYTISELQRWSLCDNLSHAGKQYIADVCTGMGISGFPLVPQYSCGNGNKKLLRTWTVTGMVQHFHDDIHILLFRHF